MKKYLAFFLVLLCLLGVCSCIADMGVFDSEVKYDYPPMIMFNGTLYSTSSYTPNRDSLLLAGQVESFVDDGLPTKNNQANHNIVGCDIYISDTAPDYIFVYYKQTYSSYKAA